MLGLVLPASNLFKDLLPAAHAMPFMANPASTIFINEIHYDNAGTDAGEAVEIAGPAGTNLAGWTIALYNGNPTQRTVSGTINLSGVIPNLQNGYGTLSFPATGIQNGGGASPLEPDGLALVNSSSTVIQFLSFEGSFTAANGPAAGMTSTDIGVDEEPPPAIGLSLQLIGTGTTYGEFTWTGPVAASAGAVNAGQSFGAPTPTPTATPTPEPTPEPTPTPSPSPTPTPTPVATNVIINEVDYDTPGTDAAEFIELYDGGVGNTSLTGLVVVFYNGNGDVSYRAIDLDGFTTDAAGYFTIGNAAVAGVDLTFPNNTLQNGQDAVALFEGNASNFPNGTGVTTVNLFDAFVYGPETPPDAGLQPLLNAGQAQINENAGGAIQTNSSGRCPNGSGGGRNTSSYAQAAPSAGAANNCPVPPVVKTIPEIQGSGATSPYDGVAVITTGIVTARKTNGFFLQDAAGDGDPNTSDALLVFTSSAPGTVAVGDFVQVTGTVDEFRSSSSTEPSTPADPETATEITGPTIIVLTSGNPLPAALDATALNIFNPAAPSRGAQLERYESMRVQVGAITVSQATNNFAEFWGVEPPRPRPFREPGIEAGDPIPAADDGPYAGTQPPAPPIFDGNFERVMVDSDDAITAAGVRRAAINVTTGTLVNGLVGPLDYAFDNFRIVLEADATPTTSGGVTAATPVPARTNQEFTVGHANLENFGVSNSNFAARLDKASLAIRNVLRTPDVLGVIEVFDLPTLQQLAAKVNADANDPGINYVAYLEESASTFADSQDVGYLVNTARVTVVGTPQQYHRDVTFTYLNEQPDLLHDRPAYILEITVPQLGGVSTLPVTVILNHTKSLIAVDSQAPRAGGGTEGARNREKRRLQAEDIADLIESRQTENLVVLGDLNAFDFNDGLTDVVGTLKGTPTPAEQVVEPSTPDRWTYDLTNLLNTLPPDQRYSYVFEGNAQTLDHVLVNAQMLALNTRFAYARYNADFSKPLYAADSTRPEALSDHDAPVAYFTLLADADDDGVTDDVDNCPLAANADQANNDGDAQGDVCDADDDNDGVADGADNCPFTSNVDQTDTDNDGQGNACDADDDNDGVLDVNDNCPLVSNPNQEDFDGDGIGDTCDAQTGPPTNKDQCKNGGWERFDAPRQFKNQGDCIQFVNTGK